MRRAPRRLTVLASLDVAGYTQLVEADERRTLLELAYIRRHILRPTLSNHAGTLLKTMGDGALVEFVSVEDGVEWAIEFQTRLAQRNRERSPEILARVGVGLADVFVEGNDRFGAAVGFVDRLQKTAAPGGISITHSVRWQLVKSLAAQFDRTEWVELKGIDELFEVWVWRRPGDPLPASLPNVGSTSRPLEGPASDTRVTSPAIAPYHEPTASERPSIAVLAFDNMSGDRDADFLADGVVEEITATLSRIRDFTVVARNSAYAYKGRAVDVRQVARALGVRYVLEGSLRRAGDRVRVTAQLIDALSGAHLWSDRFDGVIENLFDFQDHIAERVAGAVQPSIRTAEIALARGKRPENLVAHDLTLRALPHLWAHRRDENAEAIRLLDQAMTLDPRYARAAAIAAWARAQHVVYNWTTDIETVRAEGRRLIDAALPAASDDPMALTALATATMLLLADMERAEYLVDRALALDPNLAWAWTRRGFLKVYRGHALDAIACFERSIRLSPLDPFSFNCHIGLGLASFALGKPEEAIRWTERAMHEKAGITWAFRDLAVFFAAAGRIEEAKLALAKLIATRPHLTLSSVADALAFMEPPLLARYIEGLRIAGLPP